MFCVSDKVSGGERYSIDLLNGLSSIGWKTHLVGNENSGLLDSAANTEIHFISTHRLGPKLGMRTALEIVSSWSKQVAEFKTILAKHPDAILILQYKLEQLIWASLADPRPCVFLEHGPIPRGIKLPFIRSLYRRGIRRTVATLAASKPAVLDLEYMGGKPILILAGVGNARREIALAGAAKERVRLSNLVKANVIGVYAGRITTAKGVLRAAQLIMESQDLGLIILGDGPQLPELKELIRGHPRVRYLGVSDDALTTIAAADFSVLLTQDSGEGRPLFAVESLAVDTPIIGLKTSQAMVDLQEEFSDNTVRLLPEISLEHLMNALGEGHLEVCSDVNTWADAAEIASELILTSTSRSRQ